MPEVIFHLTDQQWDLIEDILPVDNSGPRQVSDRLAISGIIQVLKSGCPWRLCPPEYGPHLTIFNRYLDMTRRDVWREVAAAIDNCPTDERLADIYTLAYQSRSQIGNVAKDTLRELDHVLNLARNRNERIGITGALMFTEGQFTQILEGSEQAVNEIFDSIKNDSRHRDVKVWSTEFRTSRRFSAWTMAFVGTSPVARAYYRKYTKHRPFALVRPRTDVLCKLMRKMISLDEQLSVT